MSFSSVNFSSVLREQYRIKFTLALDFSTMLWKLLPSAFVVLASSAVKFALLLCFCCGISILGSSNGVNFELTVANNDPYLTNQDSDSISVSIPAGGTISINFSQATIDVDASLFVFNGSFTYGVTNSSRDFSRSAYISDSRFMSTTAYTWDWTNDSPSSNTISIYATLRGNFDRALYNATVTMYVSWSITGGDDTGGDDTGGDDTGGDDTGGDDTGGDDTGGDDTGGDHDQYDGRFYYTIDSDGYASGTANYVTDGAFSDYSSEIIQTFNRFREVDDTDPELKFNPNPTNPVFLDDSKVDGLYPSVSNIMNNSASIPSKISDDYSSMDSGLTSMGYSYENHNADYTSVPILYVPALFSPSGVSDGYQYIPNINTVLSYFSTNPSGSVSSLTVLFSILFGCLCFYLVFSFLIFVLKTFFWK